MSELIELLTQDNHWGLDWALKGTNPSPNSEFNLTAANASHILGILLKRRIQGIITA